MPFDIESLRADFAPLHLNHEQKPLIYLDSAATTHKPQPVLDALLHYYQTSNANVHRASHRLSSLATEQFEAARQRVARFINAKQDREIIWTQGTTEGINRVVQCWAEQQIVPGDEIILSILEHHANFVPWQQLAQRKGAHLRVIPLNKQGELDLDWYRAELNVRTKLVAINHVSNALGTLNPVQAITRLAHQHGARVLVDGAQAVAHLPIDVQAIGCDFYTFSGHKMYAPTGIGVLYGREALLEQMRPWQYGGEMIESVTLERSTFAPLPFKLEAGTPNIAGAIGLAAAIDYLQRFDLRERMEHEQQVMDYAKAQLSTISGLKMIAPTPQQTGVISFVLEDAHAQDVGMLLDMQGVAVRVGHHCAMPLLQSFGLHGTIRASFALYSHTRDVDALVAALHTIHHYL